MAIELEIRDGSPHWYLSPDVWTVSDPNDTTESLPVAGVPCYLKASVRNVGSTNVTNATVRFYWGNPAIGINRNTANLIGQSFVSLSAGDNDDVLCLTPWVPEFLNEGHECIIAEAFHPNDPLPATIDFNVPTDRHVAQRNLSVQMALKFLFHFNFEMHNPWRKKKEFNVKVEQIKIESILKQFPTLKKQLRGKKEGKLKTIGFTNKPCPDSNGELNEKKKRSESQEGISLEGFARKQMAITGKIDGDFVFLNVQQFSDETQTGGLGVLIINH